MSDFQERLVAADPVAGHPYAHHDPEAMFSRIVTQHRVGRDGVLRAFKLKMAGAVTMASLVTAGGIAVLQSAVPGIPVLAFASAGSQKVSSALQFAVTAAPLRVHEEFNFATRPDLASTSSTGNAYRLEVPTNSSAEVDRVGSIFRSAGPSSPFVSISYVSAGVPQWTYRNNSTVAPSSRSSLASPALIDKTARGYVRRLDYGYAITHPQYSSSKNQQSVSYDVVVDGVVTEQGVRFTFGSNFVLAFATGPAFTIGSTVAYPLQSPLAGVDVLNDQQLGEIASSSGSARGLGPPRSTTSPAPTGSLSPTTPDRPPVIHVTLHSVVTTLHSVVLTNGTTWLVPDYVYTGTVNGTTSSGTWSTIAIDPSYVKLPVSKGPPTS
jgi:hypothetical protein